jgi:hypothetical protein
MLVIGNGESRKTIDIDKIDQRKVGCNAIMRDYSVDHLVCVDRRMVEEAIKRKANEHCLVYTRKEWFSSYKTNKRIRTVPDLPYAGSERWDEPFNWGSGPYAILLAAKLTKERTVSLVGFDLYGRNNKVNNVYKDTEGYDTSSKRAVDPRYWVHQTNKIFEAFTNIKFTIYQEDDWQMPSQWKKSNVLLDSISNIYYNA